jgi:hypothetical protein
MSVIKWNENKPEGHGEPAAKGKFLQDLAEARVFWKNCEGYFEVTFCGNRYHTLPEHLDTLLAAKEYAEEQALSMLVAATEEER